MLDELTAVECLRRLQAGELSAVELATETLSRIEAASDLNAVAALDADATLAAAAGADAARAAGSTAPLLGLPLTIKDTIAVAGMPFRSGSLAREHNVAQRTRRSSRALRDAGAVVAAKTAVPEYAWSYETESALQGRTLNAFDPARTSGGSSGGEGALIGRGASIAGLGTDGGGSIRVPSHYNGIVGLRPTAGLVPETGGWPTTRDTGMLDMVCIGPMARSVDDVALLLRTIAGRDGHDPFVSVDGYTGDHRAVDPAELRVGFYAQDGVWPASAETEETVRRAAGRARGRRRGGRRGRPAAARGGRGRLLPDDGRRRWCPRARRPRPRGRAPHRADALRARADEGLRGRRGGFLRAARPLGVAALPACGGSSAATTSSSRR